MATKKIAHRETGRGSGRVSERRGPTLRKHTSTVPHAASRRDVEIQTRHVALDPAWRDSIEGEIAALVARHPQILRTHVTMTRARHQKRERDTVSIVANAAGSVLRAEKRGETMERALRSALAALGRAAKSLRRPKRALRPRRGREVLQAQPATLAVKR